MVLELYTIVDVCGDIHGRKGETFCAAGCANANRKGTICKALLVSHRGSRVSRLFNQE